MSPEWLHVCHASEAMFTNETKTSINACPRIWLITTWQARRNRQNINRDTAILQLQGARTVKLSHSCPGDLWAAVLIFPLTSLGSNAGSHQPRQLFGKSDDQLYPLNSLSHTNILTALILWLRLSYSGDQSSTGLCSDESSILGFNRA